MSEGEDLPLRVRCYGSIILWPAISTLFWQDAGKDFLAGFLSFVSVNSTPILSKIWPLEIVFLQTSMNDCTTYWDKN
jgi:hypothetical protein